MMLEFGDRRHPHRSLSLPDLWKYRLVPGGLLDGLVALGVLGHAAHE